MSDKEIDHEYTDETVCPYCGHEGSESYELGSRNDEDGITDCGECSKEFYWSRSTTIKYSTSKKCEASSCDKPSNWEAADGTPRCYEHRPA